MNDPSKMASYRNKKHESPSIWNWISPGKDISSKDAFIQQFLSQNEIASVSEYIVELLAKREKETESREKNGFIREWTSVDKVNSANGKRKLLLNLNSALQFVSQSDSGKAFITKVSNIKLLI